MKIARIETQSVKVPYTFGGDHKGEGLRTWTTNNILLVRVETDDGIVGWGEAFCYACTDAVRAAVHNMIAPIAIGQDARDIARLSYDLQQKLHLFGRYGITIFALSGLDIARWDIAGKAAGLPLHRLLGGAGRDKLPAYASLLKYRDPEKVAARTRQAVEEGYRHIKLHETEEPEVKAARLAAGNDVAIMVDTNCPWTPEQARHMTLKLRQYDLHWHVYDDGRRRHRDNHHQRGDGTRHIRGLTGCVSCGDHHSRHGRHLDGGGHRDERHQHHRRDRNLTFGCDRP